ncbi:WD40 repeat-like protein [Trichodelitschia bisporula]|uniref:Probable cytosolic iron-sulfur protein assembly protein 1 n=1 Tax=Trichodelitschia bisporula TaxID=703511 RepID=A0A6G1HTN8_9PEZI|nr:WD40 repeat-like protein [Trichodelitschia bisporula]
MPSAATENHFRRSSYPSILADILYAHPHHHPAAMSSSSPPYRLSPLATLTPASTSRTWLSAPHPTLPLVATATSDKSVRVYSLTTFTLISSIAGGHKRSIRSCAWKPNTRGESVLATGSFDASAGIWRRAENDAAVEEVDFTRRGARGDDSDEEGGDEDEWQFSVILDGHDSEIKSVAWSAGGQFLATCSRDKSVWVWEEIDEDSFETIAVLQEHEADVKCVAWHPMEDLLASGSYDDTIRLYREDLDDWTCVAVLSGHKATVWCVTFEPSGLKVLESDDMAPERREVLEARKKGGPRLLSSSDDQTIRLWRRKPKDTPAPPTGQGRMPSIIRSNSIEEDWFEETQLPQRHSRTIYSVSWSPISGMIVSTGSDGKIVVYKEQWRDNSGPRTAMEPLNTAVQDQPEAVVKPVASTEWVVVAEVEASHDVYEVNHVCWTKRRDKGRRSEDEEIILSTGDDGEVKVWTLETE